MYIVYYRVFLDAIQVVDSSAEVWKAVQNLRKDHSRSQIEYH